MSESVEVMERIAEQIGPAFEAADLSAISELLDPQVHWGPPGDPSPPCQNRQQVLSWYQRGKDSGTRARIIEIVVLGDDILVGLQVHNATDSKPQDNSRWQILSVGNGLIVNIAGFDDREEAIMYAGGTS